MGQTARKTSKEKQDKQGSLDTREPQALSPSADPQTAILDMQRAVGNQAVSRSMSAIKGISPAGRDQIPPIVQDVLCSPGQPMDPATRAFMESRFGQDFSQVRIHDNRQASDSASTLNALAFTAGHHIVFRTGRYKPNSSTGKRLLSHELAHVAQQSHHSLSCPQRIAERGSASERNAETAAASISAGGSARVTPVGVSQVALFRDTRLDRYLRSLPQIAKSAPEGTSPYELVHRIILHFRGVNLRDPDNLRPISTLVAQHFPIEVFGLFLQRVETDISTGRMSRAEARYQNPIMKIRQLHRTSLGTYGGPTQLAGMWMERTERFARMMTTGVIQFVQGVVQGLKEAKGSDKLANMYLQKYRKSYTIGAVGPSIFATGALVGIGVDFWKTLKGIWELITNFSGMMKKFRELFAALMSNPGFSRIMGRKMGLEWHAKLSKLVTKSVFKITYELGKMIGPTIIYAALSIIGTFTGYGAVIMIPGAIVRLARFLITIIRRIPSLLRIIRRIGGHFARRLPRAASRLGRKAGRLKSAPKGKKHRQGSSSRTYLSSRTHYGGRAKRSRTAIPKEQPSTGTSRTQSTGRGSQGRTTESAKEGITSPQTEMESRLLHRESMLYEDIPDGGIPTQIAEKQGVKVRKGVQENPDQWYYWPPTKRFRKKERFKKKSSRLGGPKAFRARKYEKLTHAQVQARELHRLLEYTQDSTTAIGIVRTKTGTKSVVTSSAGRVPDVIREQAKKLGIEVVDDVERGLHAEIRLWNKYGKDLVEVAPSRDFCLRCYLKLLKEKIPFSGWLKNRPTKPKRRRRKKK